MQHLMVEIGIRSNRVRQLAQVLLENGYDTVEDFDGLTDPELRGLGFADGYIKRVQAYRARVTVAAAAAPEQADPGKWIPVRAQIPRAAVVLRDVAVPADMSNPSTPPRSPPRLRLDPSLNPPAFLTASEGGLEVYPVVDSGAPRILEPSEYHRAVLVSHSRRDPAALNATYAMIWALRLGTDPDTGAPFSNHCHKSSRRVELWTDKEQLAERGGEDWNKPILRAMAKGVATVVFLSNAFCGSGECCNEALFAVRKHHAPIPVWLEDFADTEESFDTWLALKADFPGGARAILGRDTKTFDAWQDQARQMEYYLGRSQAVPADRFDLTEFVCDICRATRDSACAECSDWSKAVARSSKGRELIEVRSGPICQYPQKLLGSAKCGAVTC